MTKLLDINADELAQVCGGVYPSTSIDPATGEVVTRDCMGNEIDRQPAGSGYSAY